MTSTSNAETPTPERTVDVAKTVSLIDQAIELSDKKRKLLIELRDAIIREHGHGEEFPRPMGVPCMERACNLSYGHLGPHRLRLGSAFKEV